MHQESSRILVLAELLPFFMPMFSLVNTILFSLRCFYCILPVHLLGLLYFIYEWNCPITCFTLLLNKVNFMYFIINKWNWISLIIEWKFNRITSSSIHFVSEDTYMYMYLNIFITAFLSCHLPQGTWVDCMFCLLWIDLPSMKIGFHIFTY